MENHHAALHEIAAHIRRDNYGAARTQLKAFLRQNPQDAEAWYLLSLAAKTPEQRIEAARRARRLAPENARYSQRLKQLTPPRRRWLLPLVAILVVVAVVAGIAIVGTRESGETGTESAALPTLAALPSLTQTASAPRGTEPPQVSGAAAFDTVPPPASVTPSPTITTTPPETPGVTPTAEAFPTAAAPAPVTPVMPPALASPDSAPPQPTLPPPPTADNAALPMLPTLPPPTVPPPTAVLPPPTLNVVDVVAVGTARDIGGGQLRVLEATRPGEALLRELAGSVPSTPANHNWVIFELLLVCSGSDNCTPETGAFTLRSNSGAVYPPAAMLNLQPVFAPDSYLGGQTWGYLGFIVPVSDTAIWLSLSAGTGEPINFGLQ